MAEHEGEVKGYLLGSRRPARHQLHSLWLNGWLFFKGISRYPGYNRASRDFVGWILRNSWREVPAAPRRVAHFHFNMLPEVQSMAVTHELLNSYFTYLHEAGERSVCGQIVTFEGRRGARLFERYGFKIVDKREVTKYRQFHPDPVYLTSVVKQLTGGKLEKVTGAPGIARQ